MTNATEDYNTFVRANLPSGMTYSNFRYWVRGKPFVSYKQAKWYLDYTTKMIYLNPHST